MNLRKIVINEKSLREYNITQTSNENTPPRQQIENIERMIYDTELENTLQNMETNTGFFSKQMKTQDVIGVGMVILLKYYVGQKWNSMIKK